MNLAFRWFCRLDLADPAPDHSSFARKRHERFRASGPFRHLFEQVLERCNAKALGGVDQFGVDTSRYMKVEL